MPHSAASTCSSTTPAHPCATRAATDRRRGRADHAAQLPVARLHDVGPPARACWSAAGAASSTCRASAGASASLSEAAYSASKFALCGWSEAMAHGPAGRRGVEVRLVTPGRDRHRDLGPARQRPAALRRSRSSRRTTVADGISPRSTATRFETLRARHEGRRRVQDQPTSTRSSPAAAPRPHENRTDRGGRPIVKALQFLTDPEPWPDAGRPDDAPLLLRNLAPTPMALVELPDPPLVGRRLDGLRNRLTGICGSDSKQVLMDFERRRRQPDDRVHLVPAGARPRGRRHRRRGRARRSRGLDARPARRAVPEPRLPAPRLSPAVPGLRARRLLDLPATSTRAGCRRASTPATRSRPPAASPSCCPPTEMTFAVPDAIPDEVAVLGRPVVGVVPRHHPQPAGSRVSKVVVYGAGALGTTATAILTGALPDGRGRRRRPLAARRPTVARALGADGVRSRSRPRP